MKTRDVQWSLRRFRGLLYRLLVVRAGRLLSRKAMETLYDDAKKSK